METVGPDHEVEPGGGGLLEGHVDAVGIVDQADDGVLEQVLRVMSCRLVKDGSQLTAHDFDVPTGDAGDQAAHFDVDSCPLARWKETMSVRVRASVTAGSTPVHSATSIAGPNRSTAWPLVRTRDSGIRSTTVTANPCRDSQYAAVGPATLAPEIRTRNCCLLMSPPLSADCGALRRSRATLFLVDVRDAVLIGVGVFLFADPPVGAVPDAEQDRGEDGGGERADQDADLDVVVPGCCRCRRRVRR